MELEFERSTIIGFETLEAICLRQEETLESIVPDACPDILRIVDVYGQATLLAKEAKEGMAVVNGVVRAVILYQPEEGDGLRRMEVGIPFTCQADTPGLTGNGIVLARPRLRCAEARALNPRKVLLRVDLAVDIMACQPSEQSVCCCVSEDDEGSICQQQYQGEHYHLAAVQEKPFTFSERVRLQSPQGEAAQVLAGRTQAVCSESKLIGNKLIFKGAVNITLLLQEAGGALTSVHETLPFSQVMEIAGTSETSGCNVFTEVTEVRWEPSVDDDRSLDIDLELLAQAQVYDRWPVMVLRDLYSTKRQMEVHQDALTLCRLEEHAIRSQSVRELVDTQDGVRSVIDCRVVLGPVEQSRDGEDVLLNSESWVTVLYLDEQGAIQCLHKSIPVSCRYRCAEPLVCVCICAEEQGVFASPAAGGIEVRFSVDFTCQTTSHTKTPMVRTARLGDSRDAGAGVRPSVVLRLAAPGEGLWELAKAYGTTMEEIRQANELDGEQPPLGRMLLIPGCR